MNRLLFYILVALLVVMICVLYFSYRSKAQLNVAPDAQREINKARRR